MVPRDRMDTPSRAKMAETFYCIISDVCAGTIVFFDNSIDELKKEIEKIALDLSSVKEVFEIYQVCSVKRGENGVDLSFSDVFGTN